VAARRWPSAAQSDVDDSGRDRAACRRQKAVEGMGRGGGRHFTLTRSSNAGFAVNPRVACEDYNQQQAVRRRSLLWQCLEQEVERVTACWAIPAVGCYLASGLCLRRRVRQKGIVWDRERGGLEHGLCSATLRPGWQHCATYH
jgi:hypothetical protein